MSGTIRIHEILTISIQIQVEVCLSPEESCTHVVKRTVEAINEISISKKKQGKI